jgi:hypothetical protein
MENRKVKQVWSGGSVPEGRGRCREIHKRMKMVQILCEQICHEK